MALLKQKICKLAAGEDRQSLEAGVVKLALSGKLAGAGRRAVAAQRRLGLPVTFKRGNQIVKKYADGHIEVLGGLERPVYTLPKGVKIIGRS